MVALIRRRAYNRPQKVAPVFRGELAVSNEMSNETTETCDIVRGLASPLPDVEETSSYGTPALKVNRKMFVRLHQDGENLVARCEKPERERLMQEKPDIFHVTEHYLGYPYVLVRLHKASREEVMAVLVSAWRLVAPRWWWWKGGSGKHHKFIAVFRPCG